MTRKNQGKKSAFLAQHLQATGEYGERVSWKENVLVSTWKRRQANSSHKWQKLGAFKSRERCGRQRMRCRADEL